MAKSPKPSWCRIPFVTCSYLSFPDLAERFRRPGSRCPADPDGSPCSLAVHGYTKRLTGPCKRMMRAFCKAHGCTFTIYPHGLTPYARRNHLPLTTDMQVILDESGQPDWRGTDLEAAIDFANGIKWPDSRDEALLGGRSDMPVHKTQQRWVFGLLLLLGLVKGLSPERQMEKASIATDSPLTELAKASLDVLRATDLKCRDGPQREKVGWAGSFVERLRPSPRSLEILDLGCGPEFWGTAVRL